MWEAARCPDRITQPSCSSHVFSFIPLQDKCSFFFPTQNLTLTHLPEALNENKPEAAEAVGRVMSCDL